MLPSQMHSSQGHNSGSSHCLHTTEGLEVSDAVSSALHTPALAENGTRATENRKVPDTLILAPKLSITDCLRQ